MVASSVKQRHCYCSHCSRQNRVAAVRSMGQVAVAELSSQMTNQEGMSWNEMENSWNLMRSSHWEFVLLAYRHHLLHASLERAWLVEPVSGSVDKMGCYPLTCRHNSLDDTQILNPTPCIRAVILVIRLDLRRWAVGDIVFALRKGIHLLEE